MKYNSIHSSLFLSNNFIVPIIYQQKNLYLAESVISTLLNPVLKLDLSSKATKNPSANLQLASKVRLTQVSKMVANSIELQESIKASQQLARVIKYHDEQVNDKLKETAAVK